MDKEIIKGGEVAVIKPLVDVDLIEWDYTAEQITTLVDEAKKVDLLDLEAVKEAYKVMVKIRTTLSEQGLVFRREINKIPTAISLKENSYLALSIDTELYLKQILDEDKAAKMLIVRKELLPMKRDQLSLLEHIREVLDEEVLAMDDKQWVAFYQDMMSTNSRVIQSNKDAADAEANAETNRLAAIAEGKKQGVADALAKVSADKKKAADAEAKEEESKLAAQAELEENTKYKAFLDKHSFNPKTDKIFNVEGELSIYRFVGKAKINIKK